MGPLNNLITSAQVLLDSGFDADAFLAWRELAFVCLLGLLGPMHYYTKTFAQITQRHDEHGLLAGGGLLTAAREHIVKTATAPPADTSAGSLYTEIMSKNLGLSVVKDLTGRFTGSGTIWEIGRAHV